MASVYDWEDWTSYSRGERGKIEPKIWRVLVGIASLSISRKYWDKSGKWYASFSGVFEDVPLESTTPDAAKLEAVEKAIQYTVTTLHGLTVIENRTKNGIGV